jgi:6-pyruvoyltetrahydropterin/6-carboxytetrahydropterin synthase
MRIYKEFYFDAAHFLPTAPEGHPNSRVHGHSFRTVIWLDGKVDPDTGLVMHFERFLQEIERFRVMLDHRMLNEIEGLENPTLEIISMWLWDKMKPSLPALTRIELHRASCHEGCVYDGPEDK